MKNILKDKNIKAPKYNIGDFVYGVYSCFGQWYTTCGYISEIDAGNYIFETMQSKEKEYEEYDEIEYTINGIGGEESVKIAEGMVFRKKEKAENKKNKKMKKKKKQKIKAVEYEMKKLKEEKEKLKK